MADKVKMVPVAKLNKRCSYAKPNPPGSPTSADDCWDSATSLVVDPKTGNRLWRCDKHRGQVKPEVKGEVLLEAPLHKE